MRNMFDVSSGSANFIKSESESSMSSTTVRRFREQGWYDAPGSESDVTFEGAATDLMPDAVVSAPPSHQLDQHQSFALACALELQSNMDAMSIGVGATDVFHGDTLLDDYASSSHSAQFSEDDSNYFGDVSEAMTSDSDDECFHIKSVHASHSSATATRHLAQNWRLDHETARRTLEANTERNSRNLGHTLERNSTTNDRFNRYRHLKDNIFMDTMIASKSRGKSTRGNTCAHIMVTDKGFIAAYPLPKRAFVKHAIRRFCKTIGVPACFICDPAGEQTSKEVKAFIRDVGTTLRVLEEGTQWANRAELIIGHLKAGVRRTMKDAGVPLPFWDYCLEWRAMINNLTAKPTFDLQGQTPHFTVLHSSHILVF